jgi:DsbC/DsbD-like thiol-disulfide interchange protein
MLVCRMRTFLLILTAMTSPLWSQENGHATAELWLAAPRVETGKPTVIPAAIRMVYEKGWHGYWSNPGEGGMKTELRWKLPAGVSAGELQFPAPQREMTGELACYGYSGEVLLPVLLTLEAGKKADAAIEVTVSWLACNDTGCAAGEATLKADLSAPASTDDPRSIAVNRALAALPTVDEKLRLQVKEADGWVELSLTGADHLDLDGAEIFPATEQALDPAEAIFWKKSAAGYQARVKKNEYAPAALSKLALVVVPKAGGRALALDWKK